MTNEQARAAVDAGAQFLVSPYPAPAVRPIAAEHGIPFLEGGFAPLEVADAAIRGTAKLFPAHVGGTGMLRSLLAVTPGARVVPSGGIGLEEAPDWLAAGAYAVGVGSALPRVADLDDNAAPILPRLDEDR